MSALADVGRPSTPDDDNPLLDAVLEAHEDIDAMVEWHREKKLTDISVELLELRWQSLMEAVEQEGARDRNGWSPFPVRQAAVEIAAAMTLLAARLPRPVIPAKQEPRS